MQHEILGEVKTGDCDPYAAVATIPYDSYEIQIGMVTLGDAPLEATLELAANVVRRLAELDQVAKRIATRELRDSYNNIWNEYDEQQEDGTFKTVSKPQLSESEFQEKLLLYSVTVSGDQEVEFYYDEDDMFLGHFVLVNSRNGIDLSDASANLAG
ncbi:DUF2262 domain-containing protein [Blastopirellula sp. JC732]|uniref:DUF2262 domain-containing protein n=1 Tax=Blastopirellula sediminis TaxID=2894196 RepID=A0A9X1SHH4_9BACT|nr:DUF2262 domain-containing protein [Blastopirellula sediminis]MCC9606284.1 DUF2262 domain-containing protein [Blastopirellula sediminis]MCC9630418.1 DUF2262 domain-containing protein [Blastopirellula sediminis]